jgi:2-iminobutanoate/2-iminopropanoate deaminase
MNPAFFQLKCNHHFFRIIFFKDTCLEDRGKEYRMKRRKALTGLGFLTLAASSLFSKSNGRIAKKREINTPKAPKAIGPYSQGIVANDFVFASGSIAIDPTTGKLDMGPVDAQTRQALINLKAVIEAGGSSMEKVVKCTVFLQDMNDYAAMNAVYAEFFKAPFPARAAVQVARLPKDVKVEIEAIAEI